VSGDNRYRTAAALSAATYPGGSTSAYIATGELFPDALSAAPVAGINAAPLLLTPKDGPLPVEVRDELVRLGVTKVIILGGPGAVSEAVQNELAELAPVDFGAPDDRLAFMNSTPGTEWANTAEGATSGLEDVDFWIAGLAERVNPFGGILGATFNYVFEQQLENLQFGDRFYYLFRNQGNQLFAALEANSFAALIERNTDASHVPANVFQTNDMVFDLAALPNPLPSNLRQRNDGTYYFSGDEHIEMYGTDGNDRMEGDQGDDFLVGGDGVDRIEGGSGDDTLVGGAGNDILTDLFGADTIKGGHGNDAINGGPGLDLLFGGDGDDFVVKGGDSMPSAFLGDGEDIFLGGPGRVNIFGGEDSDWLEGGSHADLIQGDNADQFQTDVIGGNDILLGRGGDDDFDAEGGDDILVAQRFGTDRHLGNMGYDWVTYYGETQGVNADFLNTVLQRPDVTTISDRFDQVEALSGGAGNDVLRGMSIAPDGQADEFPQMHKMTNSTLDMVAGLRQLLQPAGHDNYAERFMADGAVTDTDGVNNLIIGGQGSDTIEGRGGSDFLDGDAYLAVQLGRVEPGTETIVERQDSAAAYQARIFAGQIDPGDLRIIREMRHDDTTGAIDTVEYNDAYQAYTISWVGDGYWRVTHTQVQEAEESDGSDVIRNFEVIQFNDTCAMLDNVNGTFELCEEIGAVELAYPSATPVEDQPITATVVDNDGQLYDLSTAEDVVFNWWVGEGTGPDAVSEWELLATTQPDDPAAPNVSTWAPSDDAADMYVRVIVNFRDVNGINHVIPSAVTPDTVVNVNDLPAGPTLEVVGGTPIVGVNVNVFPPTDGDGIEGAVEAGLVYRYEVSASPTFDAGTPIEVRQESTQVAYTLRVEDVGLYLRVVVEYADDLGAAEVATSAIVGPVAPAT
jgi:Ca2+-binding RTX toxin-like protein